MHIDAGNWKFYISLNKYSVDCIFLHFEFIIIRYMLNALYYGLRKKKKHQSVRSHHNCCSAQSLVKPPLKEIMGEWLNAVTFSKLILSADFICMCKVQREASHCNISNTTGSGSIVSPSVWLTAEVEEQRNNRDERRRNKKTLQPTFWFANS